MTDPTELIARLENGLFYTGWGETSDVPDEAAAMLRILAAERDAAIAERDALRRALLPRLFENDKYLAALTWCGRKERETFSEDVEYFKNNCLSLPGLTDFLVNHVTGGALNPEKPE